MSENRGQSRVVHEPAGDRQTQLLRRLGQRSIVFVGLMGAGKTAIGRKVAATLDLPFADSDHEIEAASRMGIPDLFERYGEAEFRALEQRVIARILENGPQVLSTGGGAFMNEQTRASIAGHGVSVWLKADIDVLMERVSKKQNRPLLKNPDPRAVHGAIDGRALSGLCDGRRDRADARRAQGSDCGRGDRRARRAAWPRLEGAAA